MTSAPSQSFAGLARAAKFLTLRRVRTHATLLAVCLWAVCAVDFLVPASFDRAANIKFQDFLSFYISGKLIAQGRAADLYHNHDREAEMLATIHPIDVARETVFPPSAHTPASVRLPNLYGPQFGLLFVPLARLPFLVAAQIWVALSLILFFACIHQVLRSCPSLIPYSRTVTLCAVAFPPLFHFFVRGQNSVLVLVCFTAAYLACRAHHDWLAGLALGFLIFKPQFLVAIPLVLLLSHAWKTFAGLVVAAGAQLAFTEIYFGPAVMRAYFDTLCHIQRVMDAAELSLAPIQMHSLRSFWSLLIPWPEPALALYVLSSIVIVGIVAAVWKSSAPLALRFSALTLAAVLVNPHLFVYDMLVVAPVLLLLVDWTLINPQHPSSAALRLLAYLAFALPLLGPLSRWTHVQLSVPAFTVMLWVLWRDSRTPSHKLASNESAVV
jgi:hypothetical protein